MDSPTCGAFVGRSPILEDRFGSAQLGVDPLHLGSLADQHLVPDVVSNRHLVVHPTEVELHRREALDQPIALGEQVALVPPGAHVRPHAPGGSELPRHGVVEVKGRRQRNDVVVPLMVVRSPNVSGPHRAPTFSAALSLGPELPPPPPVTVITSGRFFWALT
ncbi:MAG: hypothetical protein JWL67_2704 [Solirubrobacterales bacterium]|nr:hypothetical protein [Solirubrobacterales bacterium]